MAIKVVKAADIAFKTRLEKGDGFILAMAAMKPGDAIESRATGAGSITLANLVCPDRQWHQRKGADGKNYIICIAKDAK